MFSFGLLNQFGELQPNWNFIFHIFAEKIFVCEAFRANAVSTLNWFIDGIFILIPGMQFQLISWTRCFWISSLLLKFNMSMHVQTEFKGLIQDLKNNCFGGLCIMPTSKHDKNGPITFIPSNFQCHILSRSNIVWKLIIVEISFFTHKPECRNL